jgi:spore coat polysaccharide biosynthesis protein SpsF (cytidylyltransferase family)
MVREFLSTEVKKYKMHLTEAMHEEANIYACFLNIGIAADHSIKNYYKYTMGFSINEESDIKNVKELMENAENLKVPSKVDIALGKSWGEAKE